MAHINSNKNAIIIQPITLQIRASFQFLTNQRAIKHTRYSESRDGLNGRCSFSPVCTASEYSWTVSSTTKAVKLNRFHLFFTYISTSFSPISPPLFQVQKSTRSVPCQPGMPSTVCVQVSIYRVRQ